MALTREQILGADDIKTELVNVPEWGGEVRVRVLPGSMRALWVSDCMKRSRPDGTVDTGNMRETLCAMCIVGDDGAQLFHLGDLEALSKKSSVALERVFRAAQRINALRDEDMERLEKN